MFYKPLSSDNFFYIAEFVNKKIVFYKLEGKSTFQSCHQNVPQTGEKYDYSEVAVLVLMRHFQSMLFDTLRRINCNEEWHIINFCFFNDSVLKLMFLLNTPKSLIFHIFL